MEIGLIKSNISIESNASVAAPAVNSRGQPTFSELMLGKLNSQGRSGGTSGELPGEVQEQTSEGSEKALTDMQEVLGLYAGGHVNYVSALQGNLAVGNLSMQAQSQQSEMTASTVVTDMSGRIVQQQTLIPLGFGSAQIPLQVIEGQGLATDMQGLEGRLQNQQGSGDIAPNATLAQQVMQAQISLNEAQVNRGSNHVQASNIASNMQSVGKPSMINHTDAVSDPTLAKAAQAPDTAKVISTAATEASQNEQTRQFGNTDNAAQHVQGQGLTEPAQEQAINQHAAALKAGLSGIEHTSPVVQNESSASEVRSQPYSQIEKAIASTLQNQGPKEFRLQLQPESLGVIDIKLKLEANKMTIDIIAASAKTQALLTGQVEKLVQGLGLQMHNVQIESVQVSNREVDASSQLQQQSFTANENADMFQRRDQQMQPENIERMNNTIMAGSELDASVSMSFDEGSKYKLNYSV